MNEPPPPLSNFRRDLPDDVDDFILRSLAKNPEIRFQSIAEFTAELDRLAAMIPDSGRETFGLIPAAVTDIPAGFQTAAPPQKADNNLWKTAFIVLAGGDASWWWIYLSYFFQDNESFDEYAVRREGFYELPSRFSRRTVLQAGFGFSRISN
jgi:serine/threonine protein kinase